MMYRCNSTNILPLPVLALETIFEDVGSQSVIQKSTTDSILIWNDERKTQLLKELGESETSTTFSIHLAGQEKQNVNIHLLN